MAWPKGKKRPDQSERMKRLHADPEFKARNRKASSERMKRLNADPEFKARNSERMKRLHADPEFKARNSERMKRLNADPEFKARQLSALRDRFGGDPAHLPAAGRAEYDAARAEGFSHGDAMEIALDALAMEEAAE